MVPTPTLRERIHALVERYDVPGPRYTSYPTAPCFTSDVGPEDHAAALARAQSAGADRPLSLYVHIPFCEERCTFCGCNVVVARDRSRADDYLERVLREMDLVAAQLGARRRLTQLHWGGGTPTFLTEAQLERLFDGIAARFEITPEAEVALEIDPVVTTPSQLRTLRALGFNRLSMGVQDFDPDVQAGIARVQSVEETRALVELARTLGFASINLDLIYGLPGQTRESWARTLGEVVQLAPDRVATYSFAYVPDARPHQKRLPTYGMPTGRAKLELFLDTCDRLADAGYERIGLDHFARSEDELARAQKQGRLRRNFQGYTVQAAGDTVAFGVTAISDVAGLYTQNVAAPAAYARAVSEGRAPIERGVRLSDDDARRREIIQDLFCNFAVDLGPRASPELEPELEALRPLVRDGLVEVEGARVRVTELGRFFVRNVAMVFDARLRAAAARPAFSATV